MTKPTTRVARLRGTSTKRAVGAHGTMAAVADALAWLEKHSSKRVRDGMARYAIPSDTALGVPVGTIRQLGKTLGRDHALALALWDTNVYEARFLATFVGDPAKLTAAQMDRWCRDFDNWAVCDTACFHLFDKTPLAWRKVPQWAAKRGEFVRRAAFALLASLALHDGSATNDAFRRALPLIESAARDERNFVKKAVSWALRALGRRNLALGAECRALASRLAASDDSTARWIGRDALRDLSRISQAR